MQPVDQTSIEMAKLLAWGESVDDRAPMNKLVDADALMTRIMDILTWYPYCRSSTLSKLIYGAFLQAPAKGEKQ